MPSHVIYARKSTESEDRQVLSIDSQIDELRSIATRRGVRVAEVLSEAKSAKAPGRPVFGQLMRRIQHGDIRGVLCWKMDRLSRNHLDTGAVLQALADGKLEEIVTSDRTYTRDGNDRFMGNFELGMATKYIDDLRANVRRGNRARLQRGWVNHIPALGYLLDPATKTIVKDPERFDLVRRMWELLLTGTYRPEQILKTSNQEWGFRTRKHKRTGGKPLCRSLLYRMFGNPFYMGTIRLRSGETYPGAHPPMVTKEEFARAQEILGRPGRPRPKHHEFALTGLFRCGRCGASVTAEEHRKHSGRVYVYYRCTHNRKDLPCREPAVALNDLEGQIARVLARLTIPERVYAWLLKRLERDVERERNRRAEIMRTLQRALEAVRREEENLLSIRLRDLVKDAVFERKQREIEDRRQAIEQRLRGPQRGDAEIRALTGRTFDFARRAGEMFLSGTKVQKRMILEAVGLNYSLRGRKLLFSLKQPFSFLAEANGCFNWWTCIDDVRTWIQDTTEYFYLPDLDESPEVGPLEGADLYETTRRPA